MAGSAWFFFALTAAICWGASYALSDRVLRDYEIAPTIVLLTQSLIFIIPTLLLASTQGSLKPSLEILANNKTVLATLIIMCLLNLVGSYAIFTSITLKNASISNLIEISYPFFTILFAWLLTRETQINTATLAGGVLVFIGVAIIYLKG